MLAHLRADHVGVCVEIKFRAPHAIDATLSPWRRLDGVEAREEPTHWLISTQVGVRKGRWNLRRLDAPIFYTVFYGPFSAVYVFAKRALLDQRYGLPVSASRRAGAAAVAREMS